MAGKLRYVLAAAFVVLFGVLYLREPDHQYLAFLKTKAWLTGDGSPLAGAPFRSGDRERPVDLQVAVLPANRLDEYGRIGREWNRARGIAGAGEPIPARLEVRIGDNGFASTLTAPGQAEPARLELRRDQRGADGAYYPDGRALIPPFLAIILAILTAKIIPSLLLGCFAGAWIYTADLAAGGRHLIADTIWSDTLLADFNLTIMGFVIFLFMAVGVMTRSGGVQGMVEWVRRFARGPISTQLCAYVIGVLIFFDDYTNCILAGTTMRPLADKNRLSREKLSYIVDATAAPIAGISIFSTWVAYEMSMFRSQLPEVTRPDAVTGAPVPYTENEAFSVFLETIPYRFYCLFTLAMVLLTIVLRREFGPMLTAERRARREGKPVADDAQPMLSRGFASLEAPEGIRHLARNAFVPVALLVVLTLGLIYWFGREAVAPDDLAAVSGFGEHMRLILSATDSARALYWAALCALVVAIAMSVGQRILSLGTAVKSALRSAHSLMFAVVILILAWSIGHTCKDLGTAHFLTATLQRDLQPWLLPVLMFALSSLVSFSTGTSYGTMAILLPNVVVLAHTMGEQDPNLTGPALMVLTIGAVLEGSIFGDHCSPISDTTVLSSVATASDHLHHVRTQAPYAVLVMLVAMVIGYLPVALLSPALWPVSLGAGVLTIAGFLVFVGRRPELPA